MLPLALVVAAMVRSFAQAGATFGMQSTGQRIVADVRRRLYCKFLSLPQAWHGDSKSGDLLSRFGADVQGLDFALTYALANYLKDGAQIIALLGACAFHDIRLFLVAMVAVPLAAWPLARFSRALKRISRECQAELGELTGQVGEMVANVRVLQAFGRENYALARMDKAQTKYLQRIKLTILLRAAYSPIVEVLGMLSVAIVLVVTSSAISRGQLSGETLLSFLAALMLMYQPLKRLANTSQQMTHAMAGARRVLEILDLQQSIPEPQQALRVQFNREICFRDLSFAYQSEPVLQEINITLPKGKTLALVGESGSGKSTLGALLLRFWDPSSGRIEVDGRDIRSFRLADWRKCIAYVPQEPVLFSGTVRENVGYGKENASEAEIVAALQAAQAWNFVNEHPQGLERPIGERGSGLSGGQRQRIALARAFISEASIILLDEATSSLDSASEALVQKGLTALLQNRTALVIAHRLRTVVNADCIAVLHKGRVIEYGSHAELMAKKGAYYSFWAAENDSLATRLAQAKPADSASSVLPPTLAVES